MARASDGRRHAAFEPIYDFHPPTGATVEVFYADRVLAGSFGARAGWFWWPFQPGCLPDEPPTGPFGTSYRAYRDALLRTASRPATGDCP